MSMPIAVQLYSVREDADADIKGALRKQDGRSARARGGGFYHD